MTTSKSLPTSMVAWQHNPSLFSGTSFSTGLKLNQTAAVPALKKASTLVKVLSSSVNPIDYKLGETPILGRTILGSPATPGLDFVGRVWATNLPDGAGIKAGDLVYGMVAVGSPGALGSFAVIEGTDAIVKAPTNVDIDQLGGVGCVGATAYQSIQQHLEDQGEGSARGKSVFINGASGGVGTFTVQIAKALGCEHIVATCSGANADLVKSLGATEVIDYRTTNVVDAAKAYVANKMGGKKFDHAIDNAGADMNLYYKSHEYLKEGGKFIFVGAGINLKSFGTVGLAMTLPGFLGGGKRKLVFMGAVAKKDDYERIGKWMGEGKLKTIVDSTFSMEEAMDAYKKLQTGRARGKIIVRVSEDGRGES